MIEVLWHGRGGQGAFTAARLLGAAASLSEGRYALAFPSFGPERRGAPMRAFTKLADEPIGDRSAIVRADYVVYLDDTLLDDQWADELKPGGLVLVNSVLVFDDPRIVAIDADGMSAAVLGRPIPNTVFLGAISTLCEQVDAEDVKEAVRQYMPTKLHAKNIALVDAARELMEVRGCVGLDCGEPVLADGASHAVAAHAGCSEAAADVGHSSTAAATDAGRSRAAIASGRTGTAVAVEAESSNDAPVEFANRENDRFVALTGIAEPSRPDDCAIPTLHGSEPKPEEYARTTCYEAGFLVAKNAGWRNIRPVVDRAACTGCLECYMHCPDGTIYKVNADAACAVAKAPASEGASVASSVDEPSAAAASADDAAAVASDSPKPKRRPPVLVAVDYDFCKGCGVCAKVCRFDAIAMVSEREALAAEHAAANASSSAADSVAAAEGAPASNANEQAKEVGAR